MTEPLQKTALGGKTRWCCRACGLTHITRGKAEKCCSDIDPSLTRGAEILPPGHRTHEEVVAALEERMEELEAEARRRKEAPPSPYPCAECKWRCKMHDHQCEQPLVKGFDNKAPPNVDWQLAECSDFPSRNWPTVALCGREKALWEPEITAPALTRWDHFWKWLLG